MFSAFKKFWINYVNFTGRTNRSDFWFANLANGLILLPFVYTAWSIYLSNFLKYWPLAMSSSISNSFSDKFGNSSDYYSNGLNTITNQKDAFSSIFSIDVIILFVLILLFGLAIFLPSIAMQVRRLRDAGFHWSLIFIPVGASICSFLILIPFLRAIIMLLVMFAGIFYTLLLCQPTKPYQAPVQPVTPQQPQAPMQPAASQPQAAEPSQSAADQQNPSNQ
ncbi:DUF805 domain-containing protein [Streptococcus macacae]|uniref:PF05656 family protein n=1 Tax=Streptococcus macacae NCTC 11558 TaxID=764298 RepID=G5JUV5_9STRE|nr:DUF805 domain-containing protein [Streptococcus macacae]EHJ52279.1 hypothetical protein STRMA_1095 [Streptococcus macacae NCTC 11558]SUN78920.1 membrane protein [Streptococcus macacae NCTC 11558]